MKTNIILPSAVCAAILGLAGAANAQVTVPNPEGGIFHNIPQPISASSAVDLDVEGTGPWVDVTATFVGFNAGDTDKLVLASINGTAETSPFSGTIFVNQGPSASSPGATVDLGSYSPGTELVFELEDENSIFTGYVDFLKAPPLVNCREFGKTIVNSGNPVDLS